MVHGQSIGRLLPNGKVLLVSHHLALLLLADSILLFGKVNALTECPFMVHCTIQPLIADKSCWCDYFYEC